MASTRKLLKRLPTEHFGFRPHEKSMTLGELGSHLAHMSTWGILTLCQPELDLAPQGGVPERNTVAADTAELVRRFDDALPKFRGALGTLSDDEMFAPWKLLQGGQVILTMPRIAVLRSMVMNHMVHHRAQLTVYLRLLNLPVPALYGPSADER